MNVLWYLSAIKHTNRGSMQLYTHIQKIKQKIRLNRLISIHKSDGT